MKLKTSIISTLISLARDQQILARVMNTRNQTDFGDIDAALPLGKAIMNNFTSISSNFGRLAPIVSADANAIARYLARKSGLEINETTLAKMKPFAILLILTGTDQYANFLADFGAILEEKGVDLKNTQSLMSPEYGSSLLSLMGERYPEMDGMIEYLRFLGVKNI